MKKIEVKSGSSPGRKKKKNILFSDWFYSIVQSVRKNPKKKQHWCALKRNYLINSASYFIVTLMVKCEASSNLIERHISGYLESLHMKYESYIVEHYDVNNIFIKSYRSSSQSRTKDNISYRTTRGDISAVVRFKSSEHYVTQALNHGCFKRSVYEYGVFLEREDIIEYSKSIPAVIPFKDVVKISNDLKLSLKLVSNVERSVKSVFLFYKKFNMIKLSYGEECNCFVLIIELKKCMHSVFVPCKYSEELIEKIVDDIKRVNVEYHAGGRYVPAYNKCIKKLKKKK